MESWEHFFRSIWPRHHFQTPAFDMRADVRLVEVMIPVQVMEGKYLVRAYQDND